MSMDKIAKLAVSIAKTVNESEKFMTPVLASKLKKCTVAFPNDQTVIMMANIINKLSNKQPFISRGELKKMYNQFYTRNTKCAELLHEELGEIKNLTEPTLYQRDSGKEIDTSNCADQVLANALESVFDSSKQLKLYGKSVAEKATGLVRRTLDIYNLKASNVNVETGNANFLVIKADYDTPKGKTSFYVPIEVSGNDINESLVFLGNAGLKELNHVNVKQYLYSHAGTKLKINAENILSVLQKAASSNTGISDAELALARFKAAKSAKTGLFANQITGQSMDNAASADVSTPRLEIADTFENKLNSNVGVAEFNFGQDSVKAGAEVVIRVLAGFGHKNPQVKVSGSDSSAIFYAVSLDGGKVGFTVPVKVNAGKVSLPSIILCNGSLSKFSAEVIQNMYIENESDYKASAIASPLYDLKPSDLVNQVREAMQIQNIARAEDALNVLRQSGDAKAYAAAFILFKGGLGVKQAEAPKSKCGMVIKASTSKHEVCGHTGLPLHKVYQDQHGNCCPLYRRGMAESYEGAYFMNSKIFG